MTAAEPQKMLDQPWYWPRLERAEAEQLVSKGAHGCFVVRPSSKPGCHALSFKARDDGSVNHTLIFERAGGGFALEGQQLVFANVHALLLALSLQRNSIAWEERLVDTVADAVDAGDDDDIIAASLITNAEAAPPRPDAAEPLYAETPSNLLLELDKWLSAPLPTLPVAATADSAVSAAATGGASDARLLNGFVVVKCALAGVAAGAEPLVVQFPATASGKLVKAELIDACAALMAFQPRDLVLEVDPIAAADSASTDAAAAAAVVVSDFDRFVHASGAVFDAYIRNEPIACTVRVPDTADLIGDLRAVVDSLVPSPLPSPRTANVSTAVATVVSPPQQQSADDALEAIARTKQLPALPPTRRSAVVEPIAPAVPTTTPQTAATVIDFNAGDDTIDVVERTHTFELRFVGRPVECHQCKTAVWGGMASEIYVCSACSFSCHKTCVPKVEQSCSRLARLSAVIVQLKPTVTTAEATDVGGSVVRQPRLRTDTLSSGSVRQRTGWLVKQGGGYKSWKRRWCVVRRGELLYFKDRKAAEPLNTVSFVGATLHWPKDEAEAVVDGRKHCFSVETAQRRWFFQTASAADLRDWLDAVHAHIQHANRRAAESSTTPALSSSSSGNNNNNNNNNSGAIFDVGHGTIGTDAGSEIYQWDLDNLMERRVPLIRWPAGAAYTGARLRHPGTVFGIVRKLSRPAWIDVEDVLRTSGSPVTVSSTAPPFRVALIESPDSQYFRVKMQRLIERQLDLYAVRGARCVPARQVPPLTSSLLRDTATIVRVAVQMPGGAVVQLIVPIKCFAERLLVLAVAKMRASKGGASGGGSGGGPKQVVRATSMAVFSEHTKQQATAKSSPRSAAATTDDVDDDGLFGLDDERASEADREAARELMLRVPNTDEYVLHGDMPLSAMQYVAEFFERSLSARELCFVAVQRSWLLDVVDADDRALLQGAAGGAKPPFTADAARDMLLASLDDGGLFGGGAETSDVRLQRQDYMPAAACGKMFEMRVITMEHFALSRLVSVFEKFDIERGNILMYVELGLFYGEQLLCPKVYTHPIATPQKPYWNEWLMCAARIRDLRRETRAVLTFYAYNERKDLAVALGWVSMPVFDHCGAMRQGLVRLGMWTHSTSNPLILTDNAAADAALIATVVPRLSPDVVAPHSWYGCGARLLASRVTRQPPRAASSSASSASQRSSLVGSEAGADSVRVVSLDEFDAEVAVGAVGCRQCCRIYPSLADVEHHNRKRHDVAESPSSSVRMAAPAAPAAVATERSEATDAEALEEEARYMRIAVQLPRLPVPVAHEPLTVPLEHVLGGGGAGNAAQWQAEAGAARELSAADKATWRRLVTADPLHQFSHDELRFVWRHRGHLLRELAHANAAPSTRQVRAMPDCELCSIGRNSTRITLSDGRVRTLCKACGVAQLAASGSDSGRGADDAASSFALTAGRAAWLVVRTAPWHEEDAPRHVYSMLRALPRLDGRSALTLLDGAVVDEVVRAYAVACLGALSDGEYRQLLLPLVSVLKYERSHWSPLAHWLLMRALANRRLCGSALFWTLRAELHRAVHNERLALLLEAYLAAAGPQSVDALYRQCWLDVGLRGVATQVRAERDHAQRSVVLRAALARSPALTRAFAGGAAVVLPTDAHCAVRAVLPERCRWLQSFTVPLWITLSTAALTPIVPATGAVEQLIYKVGDDLRQDALTLLLLGAMNRVWQLEGLDMRMTLYDVLPTGASCGFIQVVPETKTTAELQQAAGGVAAVFRRNVIAEWLRAKHEPVLEYKRAVDNFVRSCAAYAVATFVIGIQDRHNDNIMVAESGHLLHIDFAHFLGNVMKFGAFNREKAPFVFTPAMAYVIGDDTSAAFGDFVTLCCRAYNAVRRHAPLFFGLFQMMLDADIPQLDSEEDLHYLRRSLQLQLSDRDAAAHYAALLRESLSSSRAQINGAIHILAKKRK